MRRCIHIKECEIHMTDIIDRNVTFILTVVHKCVRYVPHTIVNDAYNLVHLAHLIMIYFFIIRDVRKKKKTEQYIFLVMFMRDIKNKLRVYDAGKCFYHLGRNRFCNMPWKQMKQDIITP
ncbi:hypothetical protein pCPXV0290 [Cowpox virus]|uniref:Uncharacterized protein n=1 Tax=Cowpox virus TaxID=10243 RepID=A0A212PS61_COWPX|nr:hypothetical protein pCPXV0290 [Cowpox virus]SNB49751.1 hypothetical protein pCPXV0290 [Cowpox virus]SNB49827.1 hypothetical protein pCPXV0290 [Cowpox virus]SNB50740.1 hypothetical protein pCPXV0290 [Cowpox virus]SNB50772.1 hypothetical protein pCPXV0290 [Cowpox virus]